MFPSSLSSDSYTDLSCFSASTPSWGKVSDIFGRKPVLLAANVVFLIGSLLCGVSINIKMLVASRVIQGIGSGGLLTLVNICVSDLFSMRFVSIFPTRWKWLVFDS